MSGSWNATHFGGRDQTWCKCFLDHFGWISLIITLPKTNISLENQWLENWISFPNGPFFGDIHSFLGGSSSAWSLGWFHILIPPVLPSFPFEGFIYPFLKVRWDQLPKYRELSFNHPLVPSRGEDGPDCAIAPDKRNAGAWATTTLEDHPRTCK